MIPALAARLDPDGYLVDNRLQSQTFLRYSPTKTEAPTATNQPRDECIVSSRPELSPPLEENLISPWHENLGEVEGIRDVNRPERAQ